MLLFTEQAVLLAVLCRKRLQRQEQKFFLTGHHVAGIKKKLQKDLEKNRVYDDASMLSTNHGLKINDNQNSLKAGERGATLIEDFILREKIHHFDHGW